MMKNDYINLLSELINIDSQTENYSGVSKVQSLIADELLRLNFNITLIKSALNPSHTLLHGTLKSHRSSPPVVSFICHADTALPRNSTFQLTDQLISGIGACDNKGGVVVGLMAIEKFLQLFDEVPFDIHFICSPNEETGSNGFHQYLNEIGKNSSVVLGLEPALTDGDLIKSRSGNRWYDITIKGIAAHSGRVNIPKLNSLHEAIKVSETILENQTTFKTRLNLTSLTTSSDLFNQTPEFTKIKLDLRFENNAHREEAHINILECLNKKYFRCDVTQKEVEIDFQVADDCPAMEEKTKFSHHYKNIEEILHAHTGHRKHTLKHSWGAADISHMSFPHNLTIDGLGPIGGGMHRDDEFVLTESISERSELIKKILFYVHTQDISILPWRDHEFSLRDFGAVEPFFISQ